MVWVMLLLYYGTAKRALGEEEGDGKGNCLEVI